MGRTLPVLATLVAAATGSTCGTSAARDEPPPPPSPVPAARPEPRAATRGASPVDGVGALGLAEGATWTFEGTWTRWDDDEGRDVVSPVTWTTRVVRVQAVDGGVEHWVEGWPAHAPRDPTRLTVVTVVGGAAYLRAPADPAPGRPWLRLPPRAGDSQCDDAMGYCWRVEAAGVGHDVVLRTNPDVTILHVDPGRGVTRFEYHHNGTTDDLVLERAD